MNDNIDPERERMARSYCAWFGIDPDAIGPAGAPRWHAQLPQVDWVQRQADEIFAPGPRNGR